MGDVLFLQALAAAVLFALAAAPLGTFVLWRRMAYFGEALAHAVLLGVALAVWLSLDPRWLLPPFLLAFAALFSLLDRDARLPRDGLLAVLSHGALALGVLLLASGGGYRASLLAYLFGDILAVDRGQLWALLALNGLVWGWMLWGFRGLVAASAAPELAAAEGVPVARVHMLWTGLLALVIALSIQVVGLLLVMALLLVPAASARPWVRSPGTMVAGAVASGAVASALGVAGSFAFDLPTGPAIAALSVAIFLGSHAAAWIRERRPWVRDG